MGKGKKKVKKSPKDDIDAFLNQQIKLNKESTPVQNSQTTLNKKNGNNKKKIDRRYLKHPNVSICTLHLIVALFLKD